MAFMLLATIMAFGAAAPAQSDSWDSLSERAAQLFNAGQYAEAIPIAQASVEAAEASFAPDHPNVAKTLTQLAMIYFASGRYSEAVPAAQRALLIRERRFGKKSSEVINSVKILGAIYAMQGKLDAAEPLLKRAVKLSLKHHGEKDPETAKQLGNLGGLYLERNQSAKAKRYLERALAIWGERPDAVYGAMTMANLAKAAEQEGDLDKAGLLFRNALALREQAFGPDHPQTKNIAEQHSEFLKRTARPGDP